MLNTANEPLDSALTMAQRMKILLTARATGKDVEGNDEEYQRLRSLLVASPIVELLPDVVLTHRTLSEFWLFIRPEFRSYDERRKFLREKFEPLLSHLEGSDPRHGTGTAVQSGVLMAKVEEEIRAMSTGSTDRKVVFVVYGRNAAAREELFAFLRALHLRPLEWGHAVQLTKKSSPYVGEVLDAGFEAAQAVVVLLTPDDEARLQSPYLSTEDGPQETQLTGQPRQNVIFEAGMAMGKNPARTIIVEMGKLRPMSDITGRHAIRLNGSPESRNELASRLETSGCDVDRNGQDWLRAGKFEAVLAELKAIDRVPSDGPISSGTAGNGVSQDEEEYLLDISRPRNETALGVSYMSALTGAEVKYLEMMEHFVELGLVREGRNVFSLTSAGRQFTDSLWRQRILRALAIFRDQGRDFGELAEDLTLNDGEAEAAELRRHLGVLQDEELVSVAEISLDGMLDIRITPSGRKAQKGP